MFYRHISEQLIKWKGKVDRKPLVLRGARQVGKTTLIKDFAKLYKYNILLNLEKPADRHLFETYDSVQIIAEALFLSRNVPTEDIKETIVFIDEIQESPKAIQLLRYFYEEIPELHVISAGSLLEFAMKEVQNFPVGRIEYLYLYPINFMEYLQALKHTEAVKQIEQIPVQQFAHQILIDLFHRYAIVGGMPEIVKKFAETDNVADLPTLYESIWETYQNDVEKYASNSTERKVIKHIMSTAHFGLDERVKFQNFGKSNYRSREVGEALRTLDDARIIRLIYPITNVEVPALPDLKKSPRLQFLDTGLVNHSLGIQAQMLGMTDMNKAYKGSIIPHLITQELISINSQSNHKPCFWVRDKNQASAEVDLVYVYENKIIPIEIKSGSTGSLKSLHQFINATNHPYAVRIYEGQFKIEQTKTPEGTPYFLMNLPYYLGTKIPQYLEYFISNYK